MVEAWSNRARKEIEARPLFEKIQYKYNYLYWESFTIKIFACHFVSNIFVVCDCCGQKMFNKNFSHVQYIAIYYSRVQYCILYYKALQ